MPPRASTLTSSFSVSDNTNEVICPLQNQDGSQCRKRCLGEKRYRSMQEHIRRAHPEYYMPKLPATKESFELMITTPPHERPAQDPNHANRNHNHSHSNSHSIPSNHANANHSNHSHNHSHPHNHISQHSDPSGLSPTFTLDAHLSSSYEGYGALGSHDGGYYTASDADATAIYTSMQAQQRSDGYRRGSLIPAASAAAALAQLHTYGTDSDWGGQNMAQTHYSPDYDLKNNQFHVDPALEESNFIQDQSSLQATDFGHGQSGMLPTNLNRSPPLPPADRITTLPPLSRTASRGFNNRPRKSSLSQQGRLPKHERKRSKDLAKRISADRKAMSAEPGNAAAALYGKRWEDLIDAAASATEEEGSRDLTPIPASPYQSPQVTSRTSLPPFALGSQFQSFQASPLTRVLTPPSGEQGGLDQLQHFPSVDSSLSSTISHQHHNSTGSGSQFQIMNPSSIDSTSSPMFTPAGGGTLGGDGPVQIYCAGCRRASFLKDSFACTSCICGLCGSCTDALIQEQSRGRMSTCPSCNAMDSSFKPFQLELR